MTAPIIVWFRQDLRIADQPALTAAAAEGPVLPVYVLDDVTPGRWAIGGAQRWWLHGSLESLAADLARLGAPLVLRRGRSAEVLAQLAEEVGAGRVHALHHYEPWWRQAEAELSGRLDLVLHHGNQLAPPESVHTGSGGGYRIYSPYQRALFDKLPPPRPLPTPALLQGVPGVHSDRLEDWALRPTRPDWAAAFPERWTPGEAAGLALVEQFSGQVGNYAERRNLPSDSGTSSLSPHLHFGEVSPATVWHSLAGPAADKFLKELAWRDFAQHVMLHQPNIGERHGKPRFEHFSYRTGERAEADFRAWRKGRTGYPLVDAGMRELWTTGWMHNRVRMVAASFLVKHLLIDWRRGAEWFWDTLVDADYGNNSLNWQWVAGTGVDASPFHRIMAPLLQSEKFGAEGYIRRWVPELAQLPDADIHDPHGRGVAPAYYPQPLIGHREARARALAALKGVGGG